MFSDRNLGSDYTFGFQGQEKDDQVKGAGNSINYRYRMHDPRLGRFLSVDPLYKEYAYNSVYAFSENRLIDMIELEGAEIDVLPESVGNTLRSWENSMQSAWDDWGDWIDEHVVVEGSANASIGVQIGVKAKVGGVLEAKAGLNLGSYRIAGAKVDFINFEESTADADMFDGDGVTVTQSVSLAVTVPDTKFGLGVVATHSFNGYAEGGYDNESYDVKPYVGVNLAKKSFGPGSKNQSSSQTTTSSNSTTFSGSVVKPATVKVDAKVQHSVKKDKTCYCLSLGVGAALGLSLDANLKIGLEF